MNMQKLPSDVIGLSKVMPPLSRRGFMSSSAAAAAGYTLAAGPVRADAIQTDTTGLKAGMADVAVTAATCRSISRVRPTCRTRRSFLSPWKSSACTNGSRTSTRRVGHLGAFAIAPNYYFRSETNGVDLTKIDRLAKAVPDRQRQDRHGTVRRSRRHRGVGEVARRRHQPARHHGLLPRRPYRVALLDATIPTSRPASRSTAR